MAVVMEREEVAVEAEGSPVSVSVLVIDDNPQIHSDFRAMFRMDSYENQLCALERTLFGHTNIRPALRRPPVQLDHAMDGQSGIDKVRLGRDRGQQYHFAFVDMRMPPGIDGLETAETIWQLDPKIHLVVCTAYSEHSYADIRRRLRHQEQLKIVRKPFDPSLIRDLVQLRWI